MSKSKSSGSGDRPGNDKTKSLKAFTENGADQAMTTNQGVRISDDQNQLKAGERGPSLLEDFIFREKITHFDHERIPERIVHARGSGAHGYFQMHESLAKYTKAGFLTDTTRKTPVFVRFSTVAGSRGSTDMARDVRGFSVKFYTEEGIVDLVGNNIPIFFIQDASKFPDLIHAVKPEPNNEIPQAATNHDTFWDFIGCMPESMAMVTWIMSDRTIPRSLRMMEGFGVHTFRFINTKGASCFVKFHWKPKLGVHSVAWDEAQKISGADPDFHRRDLWEAIEAGQYPEWEFGVQIVPEADEHKFNFDLLDPTKLIPEEMVPVQRVGTLVLNRNPDNFFAETEQVAFHPGHIVPGIDFSNDPLLQGRLFSYTDTQLIRLGGPNFAEIPINRPTNEMHNHQRDGHMRQAINAGRVAYEPNTLGNGHPFQSKIKEGGFASFAEKIDARKIRGRSDSFFDFYSQAKLFYDSQSDHEKNHMVKALQFELGSCKNTTVRTRMLFHLAQVNKGFAQTVAQGIGMQVPDKLEDWPNKGFPADANPEDWQDRKVEKPIDKSPALSMVNTIKDTIQTRCIAILVADGVDVKSYQMISAALTAAGAVVKTIAPRQGTIDGDGGKVSADATFLTKVSVLFDAVYVPGGEASVQALLGNAQAVHFVREANQHCKAICATSDGIQLLTAAGIDVQNKSADFDNRGIVGSTSAASSRVATAFINAIAQHRHWEREKA